MSLVRVGMSENRKYGDGFDAIFKKTKPGKRQKPSTAKRVKKVSKRK